MTAPPWQHPRANRRLRLRGAGGAGVTNGSSNTGSQGVAGLAPGATDTVYDIAFELQRSARRRSVGLQISPEGLRVLAPQRLALSDIDALLQRKARWVLDKLHTMQTRPPRPAAPSPTTPATPAEAAAHRQLLEQARTRWGSANSRGHIALNWRLIHLAPELIDYVVVHELSHLRHMNHSPAFWATVASILPDHAQRRLALRGVGLG